MASSLERRIVTILFADIVGFTPLSERLDPEDLVTIQDGYFAAVRETAERYQGTVAKYIGDAVMAVFGVPRAREDDAERAVRAALAVLGAVEQVGATLDLEPGTLKIRIGVNTGEVAAQPGSTAEMTVTGDTVNVAARLQTAAPEGGVLVGETTALSIQEAVELKGAGPLALKGKAEGVTAFEVIGLRPEPSRDHAMGRLRAPMTGREAEIELLRKRLSKVSERGSACLVVAAPGVGKSRLVNEVAGSLEGEGVAVLKASCQSDAPSPYDPVAQLIESALRGGDPVSSLPERLKEAIPSPRAEVVIEETLALIDRGDDRHAGREGTNREDLFDAWLAALTNLAASPAVWIIEDLHQAPDDLLAFLSQSLSAPVLIVATARPVLFERDHPFLTEQPTRFRIDLPGLAAAHSSKLVEALVGDALPDKLVATIAERSDGTPLFIEELLRAWVSSGVLAFSEDRWNLAVAVEEVPMPRTVRAIYAAQLDDLPNPARETARRGSVAGRTFPQEALERLGTPAPVDGIEVLLRRDTVSGPTQDTLLGPTFTFRHALLREAGYASLARTERASLHLRLAGWLEEAAGESRDDMADSIARHFSDALENLPSLRNEVEGLERNEIARRAAWWYEQAARAAVAAAATDSAQALLHRSLDLTSDVDELDRSRRLRILGELLHRVAHMNDAINVLTEARDIARAQYSSADNKGTSTAREAYALAADALSAALVEEMRFQPALDTAASALAELGEGVDPATAHLELRYGEVRSGVTNEPSHGRDAAQKVLATARAEGDIALELRALRILPQTGGSSEALLAQNHIIELAKKNGDFASAALSQADLAWLHLDDLKQAWECTDLAVELVKAHALKEPMCWVELSRCELGLRTGDWDQAVASGLAAIDIAEANGYFRPTFRTWLVLSPIALARGDIDLLSRGADWFDRNRPSFPSPTPYGRLTDEACEQRFALGGLRERSPPDAEELLPSFKLSAGGAGPLSWMASLETIIGVWIESGDQKGVEGALEVMEGQYSSEEYASARKLALGKALTNTLRARALLAGGAGGDEVEEMLLAAVEHARLAGTPWWIAKAIGVLEDAGLAPRQLRSEAEAIRARLGIAS